MNIYIIAQDLDFCDQGEDRFFKLGRKLNSRGHDVTVFTVSGAVDLDLGKKKIGLVQKNGLKVIAFNVGRDPRRGGFKKLFACLKFARMTWRQGQRHPRPDLVIAASPPLTAVLSALKLTEYYRVPLVMEVRELWPGGNLCNGVLTKACQRMAQKTYEQAGRIIACRPEIAAAIKERLVEPDKVQVIEDRGDERLLIEKYEGAIEELTVKNKNSPHREEGK